MDPFDNVSIEATTGHDQKHLAVRQSCIDPLLFPFANTSFDTFNLAIDSKITSQQVFGSHGKNHDGNAFGQQFSHGPQCSVATSTNVRPQRPSLKQLRRPLHRFFNRVRNEDIQSDFAKSFGQILDFSGPVPCARPGIEANYDVHKPISTGKTVFGRLGFGDFFQNILPFESNCHLQYNE
jgi:hypothetical protein